MNDLTDLDYYAHAHAMDDLSEFDHLQAIEQLYGYRRRDSSPPNLNPYNPVPSPLPSETHSLSPHPSQVRVSPSPHPEPQALADDHHVTSNHPTLAGLDRRSQRSSFSSHGNRFSQSPSPKRSTEKFSEPSHHQSPARHSLSPRPQSLGRDSQPPPFQGLRHSPRPEQQFRQSPYGGDHHQPEPSVDRSKSEDLNSEPEHEECRFCQRDLDNPDPTYVGTSFHCQEEYDARIKEMNEKQQKKHKAFLDENRHRRNREEIRPTDTTVPRPAVLKTNKLVRKLTLTTKELEKRKMAAEQVERDRRDELLRQRKRKADEEAMGDKQWAVKMCGAEEANEKFWICLDEEFRPSCQGTFYIFPDLINHKNTSHSGKLGQVGIDLSILTPHVQEYNFSTYFLCLAGTSPLAPGSSILKVERDYSFLHFGPNETGVPMAVRSPILDEFHSLASQPFQQPEHFSNAPNISFEDAHHERGAWSLGRSPGGSRLFRYQLARDPYSPQARYSSTSDF
ncbi:hypothetical protein T439DRAFT_381565 [Meredithblackwellia eburnea MCA 4105]